MENLDSRKNVNTTLTAKMELVNIARIMVSLAVFEFFAFIAPETVLGLIINCVSGNCSGNESAQPQDLSDAIEYPLAPPGS